MKSKRVFMIMLVAAALIVLMLITSFAADTFSDTWSQDNSGTWHVYRPVGSGCQLIRGAWLCDDAVTANEKNVWYLIDRNGNLMSAGLVKDGSGNYYSMETNHNGYYGMLRYKSGDYKCGEQIVHLELESAHNGSFGAIRNAEAITQLKSIYGLVDVSEIDSRKVLYTSSWTKLHPSPVSYESMDRVYDTFGSVVVTPEKRKETTDVINQFIARYITADMTDFDKEMTIIRWMIANTEYDYDNYLRGTVPDDSYSAYGALALKKAVCDGYTYAFAALGKACGLNVICVLSKTGNHSWNMINLDGEWYHVDVTWEDPISYNHYGFNELWNRYINLSDTDVRNLENHSDWEGAGDAIASATKYGPQAVNEWMNTYR